MLTLENKRDPKVIILSMSPEHSPQPVNLKANHSFKSDALPIRPGVQLRNSDFLLQQKRVTQLLGVPETRLDMFSQDKNAIVT